MSRINEHHMWAILLAHTDAGPVFASEMDLEGPPRRAVIRNPWEYHWYALFDNKEEAEFWQAEKKIEGKVVPVIVGVFPISEAEADADYMFFRTREGKERTTMHLWGKDLIDLETESFRRRIALLEDELAAFLNKASPLNGSCSRCGKPMGKWDTGLCFRCSTSHLMAPGYESPHDS